jgi:hypothetical protein
VDGDSPPQAKKLALQVSKAGLLYWCSGLLFFEDCCTFVYIVMHDL